MNGKHVLYMLNIESEYYVTGLHAWNREYFLWHLETIKKEIFQRKQEHQSLLGYMDSISKI